MLLPADVIDLYLMRHQFFTATTCETNNNNKIFVDVGHLVVWVPTHCNACTMEDMPLGLWIGLISVTCASSVLTDDYRSSVFGDKAAGT